LCHHVYRGNVGDGEEFSTSLSRMLGMLDLCQIARDTVTLVFDKGSAALANTVELQEAGVGWISALPWNQAPTAFRERAVEQLQLCSSAQPGVRAAAEKLLVHGQQYLCVLKYSASFAGERSGSSITASVALYCSPIEWIAAPSKSPAAIPDSQKSTRSCAASKMATG
jgi:transposase